MEYLILVVIALNSWGIKKLYGIEVRLKVVEIFVSQYMKAKQKGEG